MLVPEIALTPQTARPLPGPVRRRPWRCCTRALTPARRGDEHRRHRRRRGPGGGRAPARRCSPPLPGLGVIVVDEEHDASYKHEADPRYDARRVAAKRARLEGAVAVFGSATPRPESWHGIRAPGDAAGAGRRCRLPRGRGGRPAPRRRLSADAARCVDALAAIEDGGGRAILLQNRAGLGRGAALPLVRDRLALSALRRRRCRCTAAACAATTAATAERRPRACPELRLGRPRPDRRGHGGRSRTSWRRGFRGWRCSGWTPTWRPRAGEPEATLARFRAATRAVLVGTQLVAKGHDVPGVHAGGGAGRRRRAWRCRTSGPRSARSRC